jgi:hypothetical protein
VPATALAHPRAQSRQFEKELLGRYTGVETMVEVTVMRPRACHRLGDPAQGATPRLGFDGSPLLICFAPTVRGATDALSGNGISSSSKRANAARAFNLRRRIAGSSQSRCRALGRNVKFLLLSQKCRRTTQPSATRGFSTAARAWKLKELFQRILGPF